MFFADRASGAYIFRPKTQRRRDFGKPKKGETLLFEGPLLQEIQQEFSDYVSQGPNSIETNVWVEFWLGKRIAIQF